jgi:hypothetical protein
MLPQALKLKVIQQYEAGKLQKDIAHDLGISTGSVSTILHPKDKQKYEANSDSIPQEQSKQPSVVAKDTLLKPDLQIISQPQSQEIQQQQPLVSSQEPHLEPSGGCPLSRFILQDIQPQIPEDIEHLKIPKEVFLPNYNPVNESTTIPSPGKTSQQADIEDIDFDSDPDIYTDPDAEYDPTHDGDPSNSLEEGWDSEPERSEIQTTVRPTRQLESLTQNAIQQATQQLAMLNMVNDQQKRAINTLVHLQQIGMTEDEIGELVKLVGRWNGTGVGVGQGNGNGISSMNRKLDDRLIGID